MSIFYRHHYLHQEEEAADDQASDESKVAWEEAPVRSSVGASSHLQTHSSCVLCAALEMLTLSIVSCCCSTKRSSGVPNESFALPPVRQFLAPPRPLSSSPLSTSTPLHGQSLRVAPGVSVTRPASPPPEYDDLFFGVETIPIPLAREQQQQQQHSRSKSLLLPLPPPLHQQQELHAAAHARPPPPASPPPEYSLTPEETLQRLLQQMMLPQQASAPSNQPQTKVKTSSSLTTHQPEVRFVFVYPSTTKTSALLVLTDAFLWRADDQQSTTSVSKSSSRDPDRERSNTHTSLLWNDDDDDEDDRAQQLFQQLSRLA